MFCGSYSTTNRTKPTPRLMPWLSFKTFVEVTLNCGNTLVKRALSSWWTLTTESSEWGMNLHSQSLALGDWKHRGYCSLYPHNSSDARYGTTGPLSARKEGLRTASFGQQYLRVFRFIAKVVETSNAILRICIIMVHYETEAMPEFYQ